jgi:hypothetical protein
MSENYEIRVSDRLGPVLCGAFAGMRAQSVPRQTVIEGWLTADEFRALLVRIEHLGAQLVRLDCAVGARHRRMPVPSPTGGTPRA